MSRLLFPIKMVELLRLHPYPFGCRMELLEDAPPGAHVGPSRGISELSERA